MITMKLTTMMQCHITLYHIMLHRHLVGFGYDHSEGSLMQQYRPDLVGVPTTNGSFANGDGIKFGKELGASLIDMDKVQLHPTAILLIAINSYYINSYSLFSLSLYIYIYIYNSYSINSY